MEELCSTSRRSSSDRFGCLTLSQPPRTFAPRSLRFCSCLASSSSVALIKLIRFISTICNHAAAVFLLFVNSSARVRKLKILRFEFE